MSAARIESPIAIDTVDRAQLPWRRFASQFAESKIAMFGLAMLLVVIAIALFAPWIAPQNPYDL
ncbi:MAG TPA: ABC transporter permease, partial [Burkholderiaceae bacterium]|nr:ABC transporter permease [Burkholderiaceae bacterium]